MTRGSYATPSIPAYHQRPRAAGFQPRSHRWRDHSYDRTIQIDPNHYALPLLAAQIADKWLEVVEELGRGDGNFTSSVRYFLDHVCRQPHEIGIEGSFGLVDLRRRHLDAWESDLLKQHRQQRTDTPYRKAIYVFALLRRIEDDGPGTLHQEVVHRLESNTRLRYVPTEGLPAFAPAEVRRLRGQAHRVVHAALTSNETNPSACVIVALHILLSLATGEPPEVLRALTLNNIVATAAAEHDTAVARMTHAERLTWLAERDLVEQYAITYTKNRAGATYQEVYTRRDRAAHRALTNSLRLTAGLRRKSDQLRLWIMKKPDGRVTEAAWNTRRFTLRHWLASAGLEVHGLPNFSRFRKVVTAREALANPARYLRTGRRHTPQTFFGHYANSSVLRAEAGRILLEAVTEQFEAAVQGPTVITPEAEVLLQQGQDTPSLDSDTANALLRGDLDGPHAACRDPQNSPHEPAGTTCSRSMMGTCFGCGNALITRHHLPAALVVADLADPARAADPAAWQQHWKLIHEALTQIVLPAFPAAEIEGARQRMSLVPLHLGTRNDMRGVDDDG
ncbi:hypothetical protein ACL02O_24710 [Micromonospora sp. MS34]|uniref:hypothetical protein n=1 Tax=Micromonospora sp. MS34 TaxID=3385971 RepID=UPI00399F3AA2